MSKEVERFSPDELLALYVAAMMRRDDFSRFRTPVFEGENEALTTAVEKLRRLTTQAASSGGAECSESDSTSKDKER